MEVNNHGIGDSPASVPITQVEAATLDIIRTETVLSRMPVHNLAKKGSISIKIQNKTAAGEVELLWQISPSRDYGEPRQLAYKLDTIIINQRIDEAGRPLPKMLRLGSLNEICAELNLATHAGQNTKDLKRAFLQNASAFITAKFNYKGNDNSERRLEAAFTRYGVIFTGEKLPDGRKADAVYIIFNEPFWEVLNNAPVRPLDRAYMKELPPAAQRFYEIVSRKIYAALKNNYPTANISYSEYCQFSAQLRHAERQRVQDQMAKIIRHHKKAGYITAVKYEPTIDGQNQPDWIMHLTPGPKAHAEFALAHGGRKPRKTLAAGTEGGEHQPRQRQVVSERQTNTERIAMVPTFDPQLIAEFTRRGIAEQKATEILTHLKPGQDVVAQLESAEQTVKALQNSQTPVRNPAGFYIRLIERNTPVPDRFETSAKRTARLEREQKEREQRSVEEAKQQLEWEYDEYREREIDRYIEANQAAFDVIKNSKREEGRSKYSFTTESMAKLEARFEIRKQVPLLTFEEFLAHKKQRTDFSLKPVAVSSGAELPSTDLLSTSENQLPMPEITAEIGSAIETVRQTGGDNGAVPQRAAETETFLEGGPENAGESDSDGNEELDEVGKDFPVTTTMAEPMMVFGRDAAGFPAVASESVTAPSASEDVIVAEIVGAAAPDDSPRPNAERGEVSDVSSESDPAPILVDPVIAAPSEPPNVKPDFYPDEPYLA